MQTSDYHVILGCLLFLIMMSVVIYFAVQRQRGKVTNPEGKGAGGYTPSTPEGKGDEGGRRRHHRRSRR